MVNTYHCTMCQATTERDFDISGDKHASCPGVGGLWFREPRAFEILKHQDEDLRDDGWIENVIVFASDNGYSADGIEKASVVLLELQEQADVIATCDTEIARLRGLLAKVNNNTFLCSHCFGTGVDSENNACDICGGYGFNVRGDIREVVLDIRAALEHTS